MKKSTNNTIFENIRWFVSMEHFSSIITFMIVSFALAFVMILKRDTIPDKIRRPLAIAAIFMVCSSFIMLIVGLFQMG